MQLKPQKDTVMSFYDSFCGFILYGESIISSYGSELLNNVEFILFWGVETNLFEFDSKNLQCIQPVWHR